jgi:hypothetical protein
MLLMPLMLGVQSFQFLSSCVDDKKKTRSLPAKYIPLFEV